MPSRLVSLHDEAIAEARAAREWYAARNIAAAEAFMEELDRIIDRIGDYPEAGAPYLSGTRRYLMRRFPFFVVYRVRRRIRQVLAVAHGRRRPGYWRKRLH